MKKIRLSGGATILVDDEDYDRVRRYDWHIWRAATHKTPYVRRNTAPRLLHRFIMEDPDSMVDHINGDTLDNRKENLRVVSQRQNQENRHGLNRNNKTGIRGVVWDSERQKYKAQARINYRCYLFGRFDTIEEAEQAVIAGRKLHMTHSQN